MLLRNFKSFWKQSADCADGRSWGCKGGFAWAAEKCLGALGDEKMGGKDSWIKGSKSLMLKDGAKISAAKDSC